MESNQPRTLDNGLLALAITDVAEGIYNCDDRGPILALIQHLAVRAGDSDTLNQLADAIVTRQAPARDSCPTREELLVASVDYLKMNLALKDAVTDADMDRVMDAFGEAHPNW